MCNRKCLVVRQSFQKSCVYAEFGINAGLLDDLVAKIVEDERNLCQAEKPYR